MALGSVMSRYGDVYGGTVNLAARLTEKADPDGALVDGDLATTLMERSDYRLVLRDPEQAKGFPVMLSWSLHKPG